MLQRSAKSAPSRCVFPSNFISSCFGRVNSSSRSVLRRVFFFLFASAIFGLFSVCMNKTKSSRSGKTSSRGLSAVPDLLPSSATVSRSMPRIFLKNHNGADAPAGTMAVLRPSTTTQTAQTPSNMLKGAAAVAAQEEAAARSIRVAHIPSKIPATPTIVVRNRTSTGRNTPLVLPPEMSRSKVFLTVLRLPPATTARVKVLKLRTSSYRWVTTPGLVPGADPLLW